MKYLRGLLLASVASAAFTQGAFADSDTAPIEDRIAALEAMVAELKAELAAEKSKSDADVVRLESRLEAMPEPVPAKKTDGFLVGDTTVKIGGILDFDAHVTHLDGGSLGSTSIARDFYIPGSTPIGGDATTFTDFTAESSRFYFSTSTPWGDDAVKAHLELDFLGSAQGNELVSSSYAPRLRRAYVSYGNWLAGQDWSTFQNTSAIPESASFLILSDGMIFVRQAQIRYTNGPWQIALENPNTTTVNAGLQDANTIPDIVARYNWKGNFGNISLAGIARQLRIETGGGNNEDAIGYGLSLSGQWKVGARDDIRFNVMGGGGIGRYAGLAAGREAALSPSGELEAIPAFGGLVAWRHPFGKTARFNIGYSGLFLDNPSYVATSTTASVQSAFGAVLWDVAPKVTLGAEVMHGIREEESGLDGAVTRFTFSTKYAF